MRASKFILLFLLYVLFPLIPLLLFIQSADTNITFFIRISRAAGIYAFVWYALQFIITARTRLLEWFIAQDRRLILHMLNAVGVLIIVVIHTSSGNEKYVSEIQAGLGGTADTIFLWATLFSGLFFSNYFIRFLPAIMPYRDRIAALLKLTHERCRKFQVELFIRNGLHFKKNLTINLRLISPVMFTLLFYPDLLRTYTITFKLDERAAYAKNTLSYSCHFDNKLKITPEMLMVIKSDGVVCLKKNRRVYFLLHYIPFLFYAAH